MIGMKQLGGFVKALGIKPDNPALLVFAYRSNCAKPCQWSKEEYVNGMKYFGYNGHKEMAFELGTGSGNFKGLKNGGFKAQFYKDQVMKEVYDWSYKYYLGMYKEKKRTLDMPVVKSTPRGFKSI